MACKIHTYLLLEYSAVARSIEHFVGCWSEGPAGLKGVGYGSVGSPLSLATPLHTHNSCARTPGLL